MTGREVDDLEAIVAMAAFLAEVEYRNLVRNAGQQRLAVARRLWRDGIDERLLRLLFRYAGEFSATPVRLFAHWLDRPSRALEKCNEMRQRSEWTHRALEAVTREEKPKGEPAPILQFRRQA